MKQIKLIAFATLTSLAVLGAMSSQANDIPEVPGIIGMTPVEEGSCLAVYVPMTSGTALTGIVWYNNDGTTVYPEILVASGVAGSPEPVSSAFLVAADVLGSSSDWSELEFTEPIAAATDGLYVVFRLPEGSEYTANGAGGGAGIGYTEGANGYTGWLSQDGVDWVQLDEQYGIALVPTVVQAEDGMTEKSASGDIELQVTWTGLLPAAPNPFNPQTELRFDLKDASDVDLSIYNVKGEQVVRLVSGSYPAGHHSVTWRGVDGGGRRLASGPYFVRFRASGVVMTQRLLLVK